MSMKKKFLALALAGAVAMPVVANASVSGSNTVSGPDTQDYTSNLEIHGVVNTSSGTAPAGNIQVELPTDMSFTVDESGNFIGAQNFEINNKGSEAIDVDVVQFTEGNSNGGINIKTQAELNSQKTTLDRRNVSIVLKNSSNTVDLGDNTISSSNPKKLVSNLSKGVANISIEGLAGEAKASTRVDQTTTSTVDDIGANETFTVKFKISKHK